MHSRLLRHFLGVVEKRNISAAAEALHISQPALTRSIRQLEKTIGVPLFERLPTGVALTKQGEVLARRVKLMELEYRHALSEISALEQGVTGTLRIGAGPMWVSMILPGIVTAFHQQFPKVKVRLTEGAIDSIVPGAARRRDRSCLHHAVLPIAAGAGERAAGQCPPGAGRARRPPARRQGHGQGGGSGALSLGRACQR